VIVLGCTHFPALRPIIDRITYNTIQVIDSGAAIARRTHSVLEAEGLIRHVHSNDTTSELHVWCSGNPTRFSEVAAKLLGYPVEVCQAKI
jgi:glutamate racemase